MISILATKMEIVIMTRETTTPEEEEGEGEGEGVVPKDEKN